MLIRRLLILFALSIPGFVAAADSPIVAPSDLMLAIRAKNDDATRAAAARIQAADAGNSYAMYNIGSLHRQSTRKGAAVFAYDPGKALKWLTRAFSAGRLTAAYKVALVYSQIGDDMEAMGWAQLYSQYVRPSERSGSVGQQQLRLALIEELFSRIGNNREDAIEARRLTLMDRHGREHLSNQDRNESQHGDWAARGSRCTATAAADGLANRLQLPGHSLIEYLIEVSPKGGVEQFAVLDAAPFAVTERDLQTLLAGLTCPDVRGGKYLFHFVQVRSPEARERTES